MQADITARSDVDLILSGTGTLWQTTETGEHSFVVDSGETRIRVTDQARLDVAGDMELGGYADNPTEAAIQMTVDAGGTVHTGGKVLLGRAPESVATATIDGVGSEWVIDGDLVVGAAGSGTLRVLNGAIVDAGGRAGRGTLEIGVNSAVTTGGGNTSTTFSGQVAGTGEFIKTGSGMLALTGNGSFTGLTTIDQGTLSLGNGGVGGSIAGNIFNDNNFLVFNRSDDFTYAGSLSGAGATSFIGAGTTTLTGDSSGLTGPAFVTGGNLHIAAGASFGTSLLTVGAGGTISGNGTIAGGASVAGQLQPGASIGTLTVTGDLTLASGSTYVVELNNAGNVAGTNNDLALAGTATIQSGATIHVTAENGTDMGAGYIPETAYTILQTGAAGNLTVDAAPSITDNFALLYFTGASEGQTYALTSHQVLSFCLPGATATEVQDLGMGNAVYDSVLMLGQPAANAAFDAMSGEVHASGQHVIDQTFSLFNHTLSGQARTGVGGNAGDESFTAPLAYGPMTASTAGIVAIDDVAGAAAAQPTANAWLAPLGGRGVIVADGNAAQLDWWAAGLAGGYEGSVYMANGTAWAGFGLGYLRSHGAVDARRSGMDADSFQIGAYGG